MKPCTGVASPDVQEAGRGTRVWKEGRLLVLGLAFCAMAAPASATSDLFGFSVSNIRSTFDGVSSFSTMDWASTSVHVYRNLSPGGMALFPAGSWNVGGTLEDFQIAMTITNASVVGANGSGSFMLKDIQGDTISGNLSGTWANVGFSGMFAGSLANVTYTPVVNDTFDGRSGGFSMILPSYQPWQGALIELTANGAWFTTASGALRAFDVNGGSLDATVNGVMHSPAPGALVLALFGMMSVADLRRRRLV